MEEKEAEERPWWDDPAMPWARKPTKADLWCWGLLTFAAIYGLAMIPLRAWLLSVPYFAAWINGSRTAVGAIGALTAVSDNPGWWWLVTLLGATVSGTKWDLLYWWAGKLWGKGIVDTFVAQHPRTQRLTEKLVNFAQKHPVWAIMLTYLPVPGVGVVYPVIGMAGVSWKKFWIVDLIWCLIFQSLYFGLGYGIGQPAVDALNIYNKYVGYVVLVLLAVMIYTMWKQGGARVTAVTTKSDSQSET